MKKKRTGFGRLTTGTLKKILAPLLIFAWVFSAFLLSLTLFSLPFSAQAAVIAQYSGGLLVYADGTTGTPKYQTFDDTNGFGAEQSATSVGASAIEWLRVAASPTTDEWIIATRDTADVIKVQVCTGVDGGVSCGAVTTITASAGTHGFRNYDVAYEQTSGDALLVYGTATGDELRKIEWTGGAWTNDAGITTTNTSGTVEWVELTSRNSSNEIGIVYSDTNDDVSAYRWSGTAVGDESTTVITASAPTGDARKVDVSFEGASGDMLAGSEVVSDSRFAYGALSGTTWTITTAAGIDVAATFIDMQEPNPSDNDIGVIAHGVAASSNVSEGFGWSGSAGTDNAAGDDPAANWGATYQLAAVAYLSTTYYSVGVLSSTVSGADDIEWWTADSAGSITDRTVNTRTRGASRFLDLFDYPNADKVLLITTDANSDVWADTWAGAATDGTAWTDRTSGGTLEDSLASATTDIIDFAFRLAPVVSAPTLSTDAATNVNSFSATLNGQITATGGANSTVRGFAWGTNSTLSNGDTATTSQTGSFGVAAFTNQVSSLIAGKTYYFRAYATNSAGTGFANNTGGGCTNGICNFTASAADSSVTRKMRLFGGYAIKLIGNTLKLLQQ